jgi:hypothetical protein
MELASGLRPHGGDNEGLPVAGAGACGASRVPGVDASRPPPPFAICWVAPGQAGRCLLDGAGLFSECQVAAEALRPVFLYRCHKILSKVAPRDMINPQGLIDGDAVCGGQSDPASGAKSIGHLRFRTAMLY